MFKWMKKSIEVLAINTLREREGLVLDIVPEHAHNAPHALPVLNSV